MLSSAFTTPTLGPVRLDLCSLFCIFKGMLIVSEGSICAGAIGVEDVVCGI